MSRYKADDVGLLLPSFQPVVRELLRRLESLGYKPVPRDTLRTFAEATGNSKSGAGIANSMHCYGIAADIICDLHGWACAKRGCPFFDVLGREAERLGMTWGGRWRRGGKGPDKPHVQGIPLVAQTRMRRLKTVEERDALARKWLRTAE